MPGPLDGHSRPGKRPAGLRTGILDKKGSARVLVGGRGPRTARDSGSKSESEPARDIDKLVTGKHIGRQRAVSKCEIPHTSVAISHRLGRTAAEKQAYLPGPVEILPFFLESIFTEQSGPTAQLA
jgi:hypothetical protein